MIIKQSLLMLATLLCVFSQIKYVQAKEYTSSGFYYPLKTDDPTFTKCGRWLERCPPNGCYKLYDSEGNLLSRYHIGVDMMIPENQPVYAISDGQVKDISSGGWGTGNVALIIEHKTITGKVFRSIYGHIRNTKNDGEFVKAGEKIGEIGNWYGTGDHLHWGILKPGLDAPLGAGFGVKPDSEYGQPKGDDNIYDDGLIDPFWFIAHNAPDNYISRAETDPSSLLYPILPTSPFYYQLCINQSQIDSRCDVGNMDIFIECVNEDSSLCVPDGYSAYGLGGTSHVPGIGAAGGDGVLPDPDEEPNPGLPDFTEYYLKLMDGEGNERYTYYLNDDEIEMHHWSTNIGEADWAGTEDDIYVRFYLSKGYKARNSDDDWVRVGTEQIQQGNLNIGSIKHEWTTLNLNEYYSNGYLEDDHVYNIVVCVDRENDTDNGDGEVPEMHESNNCTSEAVFVFKEYTITPIERQALVALYDSTNGPSWTNNTNWKTDTDPCSWNGVSCSGGHVNSLYLTNNKLSGSIPPEIGNLRNLTDLWLDYNQLSGFIPSQIGNLYNLNVLKLYANQLSGLIPPEIGNLINLTQLWLGNNQLNGPLPSEIWNLYNLTFLQLEYNPLNCTIPPEIGNLSNLTYLGLAWVQLSGTIPPEIGNLRNLTDLFLDYNQLSGPIPSEIWNLTNLVGLGLGYNQLSGFIPPEIGNLKNLRDLRLGPNQLSGSIPPEIGNLNNLMSLDLRMSQLTGPIPPEIGNLTDLTDLNLHLNQLIGPIPREIWNLTKLRSLLLNHNPLGGSIPPEIGNLVNLELLYLGANQLSGSIPLELWNLKKLSTLYLHSNQLSGSIPPEIGNLSNLTGLDLRWNQLSGSLPGSLGNLTNLYNLGLSDNKLSGIVPLAVAKLSLVTGGLCSFNNNDPSLCIPNTSEYIAIGKNPICSLSLSSWCNPGNINQDNITDLKDAILGLQVISGMTPSQAVYKDNEIGGDSKIGMEEVIFILQQVSGGL